MEEGKEYEAERCKLTRSAHNRDLLGLSRGLRVVVIVGWLWLGLALLLLLLHMGWRVEEWPDKD